MSERADNGRPTADEVQRLVDQANRALKSEMLNLSNVRHAFSAIRPVPVRRNEQQTRRPLRHRDPNWEITDHAHFEGAEKIEGLISVISGNWTRARRIAERAVNLAAKKAAPKTKRKLHPCRTKFTALWGGEVWRMRLFRKAAAARHPEIAPGILRNLVNAYGSRYREVLALASADDRYWARLDPIRPEIAAQVIYAVRREWARNLDDVLYRRIGIGQTGEPSEDTLKAAADLMGDELEWSPAERARQIVMTREAYQYL